MFRARPPVHDGPGELAGRVVIVPQADTKAGAAVARTVCEAGATAVLVGNGFAQLGSVAAELHRDTGAPIMIFAGDLAREDSRVVLAEMVSELFPDQAGAALENLTGASGTR
jgi:NAD(P)-dependent dehydrogenase (short-subunit alcohol dehydrogenase family)